MSNLHRIMWIDDRIRCGTYPNCTRISAWFEISRRQASRDIEYMKYSLGAPIEYSHVKNGYYYTDETFILPYHYLTKDEKNALSYLAARYNNITGSGAKQLANLFSRITREDKSISHNKLNTPLIHCGLKTGSIHETLTAASKNKLKVKIEYINASNKKSTRIIHPYVFFDKNHTRYVICFCELRSGIRVFRMERFKNARLTNEAFEISPEFDAGYYDGTFNYSMKPYKALIEFEKPIDEEIFKYYIRKMPDNLYEINFFKSGILLSKLFDANIPFRIQSPSWLKDKLKRRIEKILEKNM